MCRCFGLLNRLTTDLAASCRYVDCLGSVKAMPIGNDATAKNSFGCRVYHLGVAALSPANAKVHCPHAAVSRQSPHGFPPPLACRMAQLEGGTATCRTWGIIACVRCCGDNLLNRETCCACVDGRRTNRYSSLVDALYSEVAAATSIRAHTLTSFWPQADGGGVCSMMPGFSPAGGTCVGLCRACGDSTHST